VLVLLPVLVLGVVPVRVPGACSRHPNQNEHELDIRHEKEHQHKLDIEHEDQHEHDHGSQHCG